MRFHWLTVLFVFQVFVPGALKTFSVEPPITALALTPDGDQVLCGSQNGLELRSIPELQLVRSIPSNMENVHDIRFSPKLDELIVCGGTPAESGMIELYRWPSMERVADAIIHRDLIYRVAWNSNATRIGTASADGTCKVIQRDRLDVLSTYVGHSKAVHAIEFLSPTDNLVSAGSDHTLRIWSAQSAEHLLTLDNHVGVVNALRMRPKPASGAETPLQLASISDDKTLRLWQPDIGRMLRFQRLESAPRAFVWSDNGDSLIIGCNSGKLYQLNYDDWNLRQLPECSVGRIYEMVLRNRQQILVGGEHGVQLVNL